MPEAKEKHLPPGSQQFLKNGKIRVQRRFNVISESAEFETVSALERINFILEKGELLTVLGPSGCGKTTLLNLIAGFLTPTNGEIFLGEKKIQDPVLREEWFSNKEHCLSGCQLKRMLTLD